MSSRNALPRASGATATDDGMRRCGCTEGKLAAVGVLFAYAALLAAGLGRALGPAGSVLLGLAAVVAGALLGKFLGVRRPGSRVDLTG